MLNTDSLESPFFDLKKSIITLYDDDNDSIKYLQMTSTATGATGTEGIGVLHGPRKRGHQMDKVPQSRRSGTAWINARSRGSGLESLGDPRLA